MVGAEAEMEIIANKGHVSNANGSIMVTEAGIDTLRRLVHKWNAMTPIVLTLPPCMLMLASEVHPANAAGPIVVTPVGILTPTRAIQF